MICPRCLLRAGSRGLRPTTNSTTSTSAVRAFTTTRASPAKAPSTDAARSASPSAPATSTSAAQPFSTPLTPSPAAAGTPTKGASTPATLVQSSVPAGTPLKGLNFLKNKTDPVALEDAEYPAWLWTVLTPEGAGKEDVGEGDLFAKSKKLRRAAAKRMRKQAMLHPELLAPKIPVYEQSVDLPAGDGSVQGGQAADQAREDLTKAMRTQRRKAIKEANFLKAMG